MPQRVQHGSLSSANVGAIPDSHKPQKTKRPKARATTDVFEIVTSVSRQGVPHVDTLVTTRAPGDRRPFRNMLARLVEARRVYDQPAFYAYFETRAGEVESLARRYYGDDQAIQLLRRVRRDLGERFGVLILDPGIANRLSAFLPFARRALMLRPSISAYRLRSEFSKHLGTRRVYRGMALTPSQVGAIRRFGITPRPLKDANFARRLLGTTVTAPNNRTADGASTVGDPIQQIERQLSPYSARPAVVYNSVTAYREVAAALAFDAKTEGMTVFVVTMQVPELDVIDQNGLFKQDLVGPTLRVTNETTGKVRKWASADLGVESFVPHQIDPKNIVDIEAVDEVYQYEFE